MRRRRFVWDDQRRAAAVRYLAACGIRANRAVCRRLVLRVAVSVHVGTDGVDLGPEPEALLHATTRLPSGHVGGGALQCNLHGRECRLLLDERATEALVLNRLIPRRLQSRLNQVDTAVCCYHQLGVLLASEQS